MRKFTLILSLLVAMVTTAMAQVAVGKVYTMTLKNDATSAVTESSEYLSVSTLAEGEKSQQWLIEAGENGIMVRNMSTGRYMNPMGTSTQWTTVLYDPIALYAVAVGDYFTLNTADNTNGYQAMHKAGHGAIVGWSTGSDNTQWNFTEVAVDAAELEALVAEWNAPIEKARAQDALAALIEQISSSIGKIALTTSMISSNGNTGSHDGTFADMLDGNPDTHYGTVWSQAINANHYIQIDLGEQPADITEFTYTWINRNSGNNTPWAGYISASTDNDTFDTLVSFDKDADGTGDVQSVNVTGGGNNSFGPFSPKNANGEAYRYIRLTCTSSNFSKSDLDYTMALAELALTIPVTEAEEAYLEHCATAQAVLDNEESTIEELQAAKQTLYNAVICDITYNYKWNGNLVSTSTVSINNGLEYPALQVPYGYTVASGAPEGNATASGSFDIELEVALPFEYAASYSEVEHWYFMTIHSSSKFYLAYTEGLEYIPTSVTSLPANGLDAYTWGFVGDPITGFQIVNKAAGETKILSSSTNTYDGNTGGSTFPILTEVPVADGNNTYWIPSQGSVENGFFLAQKGYADNKMNTRDSKLAYWNTGADAGSTFLVTERPFGAEALAELITEIENSNIVAGTTVGSYTEASVTALNNALATAKAVTNATDADVQALRDALNSLSIILPDANKFYTINSVAYSGQSMFVNENNAYRFGTGTDASHVFQFVPTSDNKFNLKNVARGTYLKNAYKQEGWGTAYTAQDATLDLAVEVNIESLGADRQVAIIPVNDENNAATLHCQGGGAIVGWDNYNANSASAWLVEEVTDFTHNLSVTSAEWATLCLGFNTTIPENVEVYAVSEYDGSVATLSAVTGVLPANEAVLVKATEGTYPFVYTAETATIDNELEGVLYNTTLTPGTNNYYILANDATNGIGLYIIDEDPDTEGYEAFTMGANKAYLSIAGEAASNGFSFRIEGTTAIDEVEVAEAGEQVIYDLTGRRVESISAPGIYIVNGKKVVIK